MTVPRATYRLQLRPDFGFDDAAGVADYLAELGVSHAYFSPYLQAAPGSTHGYDVVDHSHVNRELGGDAGHARMCAALKAAGLGQVLDIVPNHMAIGPENAWWWDLLENGSSSRYALYFDVAWDPPEAKLRNTILLPLLGDHYGRVLEAGDLQLERSPGSFRVRYFEHVFPIAPSSIGELLAQASRRADSDDLRELSTAAAGLRTLEAREYEAAVARHSLKEQLKSRLNDLAQRDARVAAALDEIVAATSADPDRLDALLEQQNYRLARWQTAGSELDYRRFFDINTLAAIRMEDDRVFTATHALVLDWVRDGTVDGIRIDHPDGLRDPAAYFSRLRQEAPDAWIVIEKILSPGERMPAAWPVAGTTGYDFASRALGLFVDRAGEEPLSRVYSDFTGVEVDFADLVHDCKVMAARDILGSDLNRLTALFVMVCERLRRYRDFTRPDLVQALREAMAALPVYRAYVTASGASDDDRRWVEAARDEAKRRRPDLDSELLDFLASLLLLGHGSGEARDELVARYQQTSGPVMAKGVEDTAFYRFNRLVCLNEVGGDPGRFGTSLEEFHEACAETAAAWPESMLSTSTHDTKRSEDVRARLALLSEMPEEWAAATARWARMNDRHRTGGMPDRNDEYLLYQTLVGAHPLEAGRATEYMEKASKEAKSHTSWTAPDGAYDSALRAFVQGCLEDSEFSAEVAAFVAPIIDAGRVNSLAYKLLALTSPGIPDLYQGSELWDLSLVDPDNRRPVDFGLRRRLLSELAEIGADAAWARRSEGLPKLMLVQRALALRRRRPLMFAAGATYRPLQVAGPQAAHLVAFARGEGVVALAPRAVLTLIRTGVWRDTLVELPPGEWVDQLTGAVQPGGELPVGELLNRFPVGLLERS